MKNVLKQLVKIVLMPLGLTTSASAIAAAIKKRFWIRKDCTDNLKQGNGRYYENS